MKILLCEFTLGKQHTFLPIILLFTCFIGHAQSANTISPSHVYQNTEKLVAEVNLLRNHKNKTELARTAGVQIKKTPLHVYGKCIEVVEKVIRLQEIAGTKKSVLPVIPMRAVKPAEVFACTSTALEGLIAIKNKWNITENASEPPFVEGKTPSHVYRNMWQVSYLLDALVGQISPSNVFRNAQLVQEELKIIAKTQGLKLSGTTPASIDGKVPRDVLLQCFKGLTKLKKVARQLGLKGIKVPKVPSGTKILPSDVYDCTNMHLAELHSLKLHLNLTERSQPVAVPSGKTPSDVYAQMVLINEFLTQLKN